LEKIQALILFRVVDKAPDLSAVGRCIAGILKEDHLEILEYEVRNEHALFILKTTSAFNHWPDDKGWARILGALNGILEHFGLEVDQYGEYLLKTYPDRKSIWADLIGP
jgi:hypothetical protein